MQESQALLRLQEIDIELMRLNGQLKAMPQQKKLAAIVAAKKNLAGKLKTIVGQRKDAEIDLEDNEAAHEKTVNRIDEVQAVGRTSVASATSRLISRRLPSSSRRSSSSIRSSRPTSRSS